MADDPYVEQLLDELLDSNAAPEEVCGSHPELLPVVRNRWRQMRRLRADLNSLFPPADDWTPHDTDGPALPHIPGYELEAVLGRGGMGVVFRARHLRLNRPVAIKTVLAGGYAGPRERARFQLEAEAVATLRHPNVVQVYDVGEEQGRPYLAMELVEGGTLAQRLSGTPKSARAAAALVAMMADAMQAAHDAGIVHRDLKPANVLLAGCTPKISDFGLARRLEGEAGLTQSGVPVGTPSYMAPEQARGQTTAVGPAADVYALGAILYECLTGRPPFRAATAAETIQQVIFQEPVPPSRLNDKVSRDLDTICLKCLSKEPARRYASAAALAEDLRRFGEGRPIRARPVGWAERSWRWVRRNPMAAALLVTALALVGLASGGGVWIAQQSARHHLDLRNGVEVALSQTVSLRQQYHFREARELLESARKRLEPAGPDDLREQVNQALADLNLVTRLDAARLQAVIIVAQRFDQGGAERQYATAFAEARLGRAGEAIKVVAARVNASAVHAELVGALDEWASICDEPARLKWLLAVVRTADPHPLRDRLRQPELWRQRDELVRIASELRPEELSPQLASALGRALDRSDRDSNPMPNAEQKLRSVQFLSVAQARFPDDFWLNLHLATALHRAKRSEEAIGYYRAALALRPETVVAHINLGVALSGAGKLDEAIACLRRAVQVDSNYAVARVNLGFALNMKGDFDESIAQFLQAVRLDPDDGSAHFHLGRLLEDKGHLDKAVHRYRDAVRIEPNNTDAHFYLAFVLRATGKLDEAITHYQHAVNLNPQYVAAQSNLGNALKAKGELDAAIGHYQEARRLDPNFAPVMTNLSTCLYAAACADVRAAVGEGTGEMRPDEAERSRLRRRALDRLRADLDLTSQLVHEGKVPGFSLVYLLTDPALAGVRESTGLTKLPDGEREQWQRLWADMAALIAADPVEQGRAHAARREWAKAAACYATRAPTGIGHFCFENAALLLLSGDRPGYREACAHTIAAFGNNPGPRAYHVARACTLAPDAVADMAVPAGLAEKELQGAAEQFWSLTEQGALAYRAGRFQESASLFEQSLRANSKPGAAVVNWLWLALANHRLGQTEEARRWLDKARAWLDQFGDGMPADAEQTFGLHLHNWLEAQVLRREAGALIEPTGTRDGTENRDRGAPRK